MTIRKCLNCNSRSTQLKYPHVLSSALWYHFNKGFLCHKCHNRLIVMPKMNPKRILFKGKRIRLEMNPRKGICSQCNRKIGQGIKQTHIHHIHYHDDDPLRDTVELCVSCHGKVSYKDFIGRGE